MNGRLRILQAYNEYRSFGGEDTVVHLEADLLRRNGHEVEKLSAWTKELDGAGVFRLLSAGFGTVWSFRGYSAMKNAIARFAPDIVHVHNSFPLLSPSIFWAAAKSGVPVVQTLHNYRVTCAESRLFRENKPCEECVGRFPWPGLRHRCYGPSLPRTAAVTAMNVVHRCLRTYHTKVHAIIVLNPLAKQIMVRAGLPEGTLHVKPNFSAPPRTLALPRFPRVVFAGRVDSYKGLHLLLEAWNRLAPTGYQLLVVGDGPDRAPLEARYKPNASIVWRGFVARSEAIELIASSRWLVLPSLGYENCPMSVLESLSAGTPVILPNHRSLSTIVTDRKEGLVFSAGDAASLTATLRSALEASEASWLSWSANAIKKHLRDFAQQNNYLQLLAIYQKAMEAFQSTRSSAHRVVLPETIPPLVKERVREP